MRQYVPENDLHLQSTAYESSTVDRMMIHWAVREIVCGGPGHAWQSLFFGLMARRVKEVHSQAIHFPTVTALHYHPPFKMNHMVDGRLEAVSEKLWEVESFFFLLSGLYFLTDS